MNLYFNKNCKSARRGSAKSLMAFTLVFVIFVSYILPFTAYSADGKSGFAASYSGNETVISAKELLSLIGIKDVTTAELRCYENAGLEFSYTVPDAGGLVSASSEDGFLIVKAAQSSYSASYGATVTWTPISAFLDGIIRGFQKSADGYTVTFEGLEKGSLYTVDIVYGATVTLNAKNMNAVLSLPFDLGNSALNKENAYNAEVDEYNKALARFESDNAAYASKLSQYEAYLKVKAEYDTRLAEYLEYKRKVEEYEKAYAAYQAYLKEVEQKQAKYESDVATYDERLKAYSDYIAYLAKLETVRAKMRTMNSIYEPVGSDPSIYATIMGDTVSEVVARRSELISAGASAKDIDNAGNATVSLRKYLSAYNSAKTESDKLDYYKSNYILIKTDFLKLYNSLSALYQTRLVRTGLAEKGKLERFDRFLGELGRICDSFRDTASTSPASTVMPEPVAEAAKPDEPVPPTLPSEVKPPVKTWTKTITEPQKPAEVSKPEKPVKEDYVKNYPVSPVFTENERELLNGVKDGTVKKRALNGDAVLSLSFDTEVIAYIPPDPIIETSSDPEISLDPDTSLEPDTSHAPDTSTEPYDPPKPIEYCVVTFRNGNDICFGTLVEKGKNVTYVGETPEKASDAKYDYTFDCWTDENGKTASFSSIQSDTVFYASFTEKLRSYEVTFVSKDKTYTVKYEYGATPDPEENYTQSYSENNAVYTFAGWNTAITPVTGNATYTAVYSGKANEYKITFSVRGKEYTTSVSHGTYPIFEKLEKEYEEGGKKYEFVSWSPEIVVASSDAEYKAVYREVGSPSSSDHTTSFDADYCTVAASSDSMNAGDDVKEAVKRGLGFSVLLGECEICIEKDALAAIGSAERFSIIKEKDGTFAFSIKDKNGNDISVNEALLVLPFISEKGRVNAYLNGEKCDSSYSDGKTVVTVGGTGRIEIRNTYKVTVCTSGSETTEIGSFLAEAGATAVVPFGGKNVIASVTASSGKSINFSASELSFVMPDDDVTVVLLTHKMYRITFMNGQTVISSEEYGYGDTVTVPGTPVYDGKAPDDPKYHYVFTGWTPEITPAIEDTVYTAVFVLEEIEEVYVPGKGFNFILLGGVVILLLICLGLFFTFRAVIRRKRRRQKS